MTDSERISKLERDLDLIWKEYFKVRAALRHANIHVERPEQDEPRVPPLRHVDVELEPLPTRREIHDQQQVTG